MIRQPIVVTVGHSDHGKTTLLDQIRGSTVTSMEPGLLTQHVGASNIPIETIRDTCGNLLDRFKIKLEIPGLLFIDTPGHAAFTSIRKRGSSIADLAILVVDITEGIQEQTDESIKILKEFKTPFLIAATKIDKIEGWIPNKKSCFLDSFDKQPQWIKDNFDKKFYRLVGQLSERGFSSERFDRINDFKNNVAIVPCSGTTGEGIPELLAMLAGLAQSFLKDQLEVSKGIGRGSILEVKDIRGLGTTIDVILYDGEIRKGDWLVVGGKSPIVTRVKALLKPRPLKEMRVEKQFENFDYVFAACGIKVSAPGLEGAIAGSPIVFVSDEKKVDEIKKELQSITEQIEFEKEGEGVILKADNLGSLEAMIGIFKDKLPIKKAETGKVLRKDVIGIEAVKDRLNRVIIAFNVGIDEAAAKEAKDKSITILQNNVIYQLVEGYDKFIKDEKERIRLEKLDTIIMPAKIRILPGHTFRTSKPAVVGVEVLAGAIKSGYKLQKDGKEIGEIKAIQMDGSNVEKAEIGDKVAVSIDGPTVGRQIDEGDELATIINIDTIRVLKELGLKRELELAREILGK
ncbi:MAG: translation initiation factor IF-2 [Candidatus Aenigmatarchaeota archaeon]